MAGPGPDSIAAILGRCLARAPPEDESSWEDELFTMLAMCGYVCTLSYVVATDEPHPLSNG